ncbi:MAG: hypothetical protein GF375_06375 [Candidatus Omnitrophica bacterium]|nr:hypothetical protein [Candidatus Omnitrophota bacterium]MBD3269600.1 hypothetical protein [Candidatus Omnitrophota bacterium]
MDKTKLIPIILLLIILGIGFVTFSFYQEKQNLLNANLRLKEEKASLIEENNNLKGRYNQLERTNNEMERRLSTINEDLSRLERERDEWRQRWEEVSRERDSLVEKMKSAVQVDVAEQRRQQPPPSGGEVSEDYWADFVQKKASLEAELEKVRSDLLDARQKFTELDKDNKELTLRIDELEKEKERLSDEIKFKERTLRVMSMDLVKEREERGEAVQEVKKLRRENSSLKKELVMTNKEKIQLQSNLKETYEKKQTLENRMATAENVLKEKTMLFEDLQNQLQMAIEGGKRAVSNESASVELPPIVVKPGAPGLKGLRGEVIAVNLDEKFVVIDLGESSGIKPGVTLKIIRGDKEVGTLEVIETRREISAADIKETVGGLIIQEGDIVVSR